MGVPPILSSLSLDGTFPLISGRCRSLSTSHQHLLFQMLVNSLGEGGVSFPLPFALFEPSVNCLVQSPLYPAGLWVGVEVIVIQRLRPSSEDRCLNSGW